MIASSRRSSAIVLRQFYLMRGSIARVLPLFAWVGIDMVLWGFMSRYLNALAGGRSNFVGTLLGSVLLWDFFTRVMQGVTMTFFEDVWSRNFLNIFASPLRVSEYLSGLVMSSMITSFVGLMFMFVLASGAFGLSFLSYGVMLIPALLLLFLFGIALGIAATGMVLRLGPASEWFVWPIPALIGPFAAVYYPLTTLPRWMQYVGLVVPPSYVFQNIRSVMAGRDVSWGRLGIGAGLCLVYLLLACWFFWRMYRHAVRTGLLARYSSETVS
ncbi:MAG: type transporter [Acidobacteriales bacterium]|nr:type transporter [Terriglobales bacterium]